MSEVTRYGPVTLSGTDADGGARLFIREEVIKESGLDPDGAVLLQPYENGVHVIDAEEVFEDG
ncbi:MAG: hypothetical protein ACOCUO_02090 [archaeon]